MINTYQTSLAPPPVPPRSNRPQTILFPAPLPSQSHTKVLIRFLVGVVVLHLLLSVGGFIFLYHNDQLLKEPEERSQMKGAEVRKLKGNGARAAFLSSDDQETTRTVSAHMLVELESHTPKKKPGYLQWNKQHSIRKNIGIYRSSWLTILRPGDYFVYSMVTFTKNDHVNALESVVKLRKNSKGNETNVMEAFCDLDSSGSEEILHKCTATQGRLITLEEGNQLSVWVQNLSLVNYENEVTTFGMYKL
ncbi:CD40 ligand [Amphiprion ocellaris]|uniref:THD domain-containing protein n=1 Tax=Amphiprion ocellaris TaxID=80972 RepID=A0AAQ5ZTE3_AMPOC|nr:CD40 ligand [Amphiprion ocellaris]